MIYPSPLTRRVNFYETDQMAIVHHSNYIRWFEESRVEFLEQAGYGYGKSLEAGVDIALVGLSCEYRSMVRFGETVVIAPQITLLTPSRMTVGYTVTDNESGELRTTGETRHCFIDSAGKLPVSLKKRLPELYELFGKYVQK